MEFELQDLKDLIAETEERFGSEDDTDSLHGRIAWRNKHYNRDHAVAPVLPKPYENAFKYQTDRPRQAGNKLKYRLTENKFTIDSEPIRDTPTARKSSDTGALVLNQGFDQAQKRAGVDIQSALADGLIRKSFGVLHWVIAEHIIPEVPDREYLDEVPDDETDRYERHAEPDKPKYRQTSADMLKGRKASMARAGFPFYFEVIPPEQFMFIEDRSLANGLAIAIVRREVGLLSYAAKRAQMGKPALSLSEANSNIPVYGERYAPTDGMPSAGRFHKKVKVYQVWTRTEFYELCDYGPVMEIADSFDHPYGMPPFSIAYGNVNETETDLTWKYEPALEGVYRAKPAYDYWMSLYYTMAESNAMPTYVLVSKTDGMPMLAEDGTPLVMSRNAAQSMKIPDGYDLVKFTNEINQGFSDLGEWVKADMDDATPATGQAEVTASTQPWAIRMQQAQENVEPARYINNIATALDICVTNVAQVMSNPEVFGEPICVFARVKNGRKSTRDVVDIAPEDIESLDFSVNISGTSAAERITKEQFGMEKLDKRLITPEEFISDYEGEPNAGDVLNKRMADWYYYDKVMPSVFSQAAAKHFGANYVIDQTTGGFIGPDGAPATSAQVLEANGQQPTLPPETQTTMGQMAPIQTPGTLPMQGPVAV